MILFFKGHYYFYPFKHIFYCTIMFLILECPEKKNETSIFSYEHKKICKVNNLFFFFYFCPLFSRLFIYVFCLFFIRNRDLNNKRKKSLIILQFVFKQFTKQQWTQQTENPYIQKYKENFMS